MPVHDRTTIPESVGRGTLDPELAAWLPTGPTLGADVPIAQGRRDHAVLNRSGLYLETNGIYEMVRNLLKNTDDGSSRT